MNGHLKMRMAQFLSAIHTSRHVIYLSRHGQSEYNVLGKIGGNPPLSAAGDEYAVRLGNWVPANVWRQEGKIVQVSTCLPSCRRVPARRQLASLRSSLPGAAVDVVAPAHHSDRAAHPAPRPALPAKLE